MFFLLDTHKLSNFLILLILLDTHKLSNFLHQTNWFADDNLRVGSAN
jgi:hypothetical protein